MWDVVSREASSARGLELAPSWAERGQAFALAVVVLVASSIFAHEVGFAVVLGLFVLQILAALLRAHLIERALLDRNSFGFAVARYLGGLGRLIHAVVYFERGDYARAQQEAERAELGHAVQAFHRCKAGLELALHIKRGDDVEVSLDALSTNNDAIDAVLWRHLLRSSWNNEGRLRTIERRLAATGAVWTRESECGRLRKLTALRLDEEAAVIIERRELPALAREAEALGDRELAAQILSALAALERPLRKVA